MLTSRADPSSGQRTANNLVFSIAYSPYLVTTPAFFCPSSGADHRQIRRQSNGIKERRKAYSVAGRAPNVGDDSIRSIDEERSAIKSTAVSAGHRTTETSPFSFAWVCQTLLAVSYIEIRVPLVACSDGARRLRTTSSAMQLVRRTSGSSIDQRKEAHHGRIWQDSSIQSRENDARAQGGNAEKWLGKESQEPEASDSDRTFRGAQSRRKSSKEEITKAAHAAKRRSPVWRARAEPCARTNSVELFRGEGAAAQNRLEPSSRNQLSGSVGRAAA